jgi:hypothetical protein
VSVEGGGGVAVAAPTRAPVLARCTRHASRAMICEHDFRACLEICRLPALHPNKIRLPSISQLEKLRLLCNYQLEFGSSLPERDVNEDKKSADVSR